MKKTSFRLTLSLLFTFCLFLLPSLSSAWQTGDIIYVDKNARGNGSGTSWNNAFTTIQGAIASVNPGTEVSIFVAQGIYLEHNLVLQDGLKLYGSFEGYETSLAERRDVWTNDHWTVIDAEQLHRVLTMGDKSEVNGFILRNGLRDYTLQSNTTLDDSRGGGIYIACDDDVVVRNNIIENCAVFWQGGGIFIEGSCNNTPAAPLIEFNVIRSNTGYCGGGIEIAGVPEGAPGGTDAIIRHNVLRNNVGGGNSELGFGLELWTEYDNQCSPRMGDFYNNIITGFWNKRDSSIWAEDVHVWARNSIDRSFISTSWSLGELLYSGCYRYGNPDHYNIFGSDPMFVDEANNNYHLRAGSPCIGAGRGGVNIGLFPYNGDTQPPVISNVASSGITTSGATITWSTNEASDSQVQYGFTTSYGSSTPLNTSMVTNHSVALSGLSAGTTYHYRVKSKDGSGNLATSQDYTFTTALVPDTTPPVISSVASSGITSSGATITWTTNELSDSQVEYGLTSGYGSSTTLNTNLVTNHSVILSGLTASTTYHYQVRSKDASTNSAVSGDYTFTTSAQPPASWDGYGYRRPITIDYTKVTPCSSNLSNFPVLVSLSDTWLRTTGNGGSIYSSNGYDIIFKALDGSTKLDHEVEKYDGSTGTLVAWVRVPTLSYTTNTTIYVYYGNSGISTDQSNPTGVWDSNFAAVWHLREDPSITNCGSNKEICDSTSNALHADMNGAMTSGDRVPAKGNGGLDFDGSNDYFNHGNVLNSLTLPFTVEAWVRHNGSATNEVIFASDAGANYSGFWFHIEGTTYELAISYGDNLGAGSGYRRSKHSTTTIPTATWTHVAAVVRGATNMDHFINGALSGGTYSGTGGPMATSASPATMGTRGTNYFNGSIDEVRISAVDRGACWIGTSHNCQNSPSTFSTLGNEESPPTGDTVAPTVPTNLTATAGSSTQINLSWTASTDNVGVTGYRIYRNGSQIATTAGTSYQNTGLSPSTTYTYTVAAYDAAGNVSAQSSQTSATTLGLPDTQAPTVPTGLTATAISSTQINLSWTASTDNVGVTGYRIYRNGSQIATTAGTSYQNTGLSPSTTYTYTVAAYDAAGNASAQSSQASATTPALPDTQAPTVPTGLTATAISSTQINLSWTASTDNVGVTGYRIYRNGSQVATTAGTSYQNAGLSPSTTYTYTVAAYDAAGNASAQSSQASATTPALPDTQAPTVPKGLKATVTSSTQINLSWTASTDNVGVIGYKIYQNSIQIGTTVDTSYQSTGLNANTSYSYRVAAYDAAGNTSSKSSSISAKTQPSPSTMFTIGDRVQTTSNASVRSEPSGSGTTLGTQLNAAMGRVTGGPWYWNLQWWWQIDFDSGVDGWVPQGKLKKIVP